MPLDILTIVHNVSSSLRQSWFFCLEKKRLLIVTLWEVQSEVFKVLIGMASHLLCTVIFHNWSRKLLSTRQDLLSVSFLIYQRLWIWQGGNIVPWLLSTLSIAAGKDVGIDELVLPLDPKFQAKKKSCFDKTSPEEISEVLKSWWECY